MSEINIGGSASAGRDMNVAGGDQSTTAKPEAKKEPKSFLESGAFKALVAAVAGLIGVVVAALQTCGGAE